MSETRPTDRSPTTDADVTLSGALRMLAPLVRLLVARGITYPRLVAALKPLFIEAARTEIARQASKVTWTAISVRSGVHRKDMREMLRKSGSALTAPRKAQTPSLAVQVAWRWSTARRYQDDRGRPLPLPLRAAAATGTKAAKGVSFEKLVDELSSDVHAAAVLDELVRLGIAARDGDRALLVSPSLTPAQRFVDTMAIVADNTHDHLAAAVANLEGAKPAFLEHALFADELRPESAAELQQIAKDLWKHAVTQATAAATKGVERDIAKGFADVPEMRVRFGAYFFMEPKNSPAPVVPVASTKRLQTKGKPK
jgi:hypothetical protein